MFNEHLPVARASLGSLQHRCYHWHFTGEEREVLERKSVSNVSHSQELNCLEVNGEHLNENKHLQLLLFWGSALDSSGVSMEAILKLFGEYFFE